MKADKFLTSKEAKVALKIQDCDLAHVRNSGKLQFTKKGNAYLYLKESIEIFKRNKDVDKFRNNNQRK